jgi:hypothetical protein
MGIIKYIFICVTAFISYYFLITSEAGFGNIFDFSMIFSLLSALTIFMLSNVNKIKKHKFIYDIILLLLMIFTIGIFLYIIYCDIVCSLDANCMVNFDSNFTIIFSMLLFIMILFGINDIFNKTNGVNDILTIIVSSLIILIHIRYYVDPNFIHKISEGEEFIEHSYYYVTQNYIYFIIMYAVVLLHRKVNKIS